MSGTSSRRLRRALPPVEQECHADDGPVQRSESQGPAESDQPPESAEPGHRHSDAAEVGGEERDKRRELAAVPPELSPPPPPCRHAAPRSAPVTGATPESSASARVGTAGGGHDDVHLDWATFSHDEQGDLYQLLHGERVNARPWWPYKWCQADADGAKLLGQGPAPRPFLLDFRGEALRRRRAAGLDDCGTIAMAAFSGLTCTRLDLARDVTSNLTPAWLWKARQEGRTRSLWRRWKWIDEGGTGQMVRCGGKESETALRVYDKRAELLAKGERCPFPRLTRWELVLRGDRAHAAFLALADVHKQLDEATGAISWPIHQPWCSWVSRLLTVTSEAVDRANKHQSRATAAPEWTAFLSATDGTRLSPDVRELSPQERAGRLARWFTSACGPTLYLMSKLVGWANVHTLAQRAASKLNSGHRSLLDLHRVEAQRGAREALAPRAPGRRRGKAVERSPSPEWLSGLPVVAVADPDEREGPRAWDPRSEHGHPKGALAMAQSAAEHGLTGDEGATEPPEIGNGCQNGTPQQPQRTGVVAGADSGRKRGNLAGEQLGCRPKLCQSDSQLSQLETAHK